MLIAQITDLHAGLIVDTGNIMIDTNQQVLKAVRHLNEFEPTPECVLVTGDLVGDGTERQYRDLRSKLDELQMPYYLIPGNHDDRALIRAIFVDHEYLRRESEFLQYVIGDYSVKLMGLDTMVPGQEAGLLCERRLDWIRTQLSESRGQPTLIFMHHPPFVTGIPEFDDMGCGNGAELGAIIDQHPEVVGVLAGHVHRSISVAWHGSSVHVAPSVSFQYPLALTRARELTPLPEPPACGIYRWAPDSGLRAHLSYINH